MLPPRNNKLDLESPDSAFDVFPSVVAWAAGLYALVTGALTLVGWFFEIRRLTDWAGLGISMLPNTALAAILGGVSLILLLDQRARWRTIVGQAAAVGMVAIGGITLLEHITGFNLGIDTLLIDRPWGQRGTTAPMRMGPPASTSFLLLGVAAFLASRGPQARRIASMVAILPAAISSLSLTGYLFDADQLFGLARLTAISWQTTTILLLLGIGAMAIVPEHGLCAALCRRNTAGTILRRLVLPVIAIPFVFNWLRIVGERTNMVDPAFGTAITILLEVVVLLALLAWAARSVGSYATVAEEARGHLAAIVESTHDAVVSKSLDGMIRSWNAGAEQLFGYTAAEAIGQPIMLIIPPDRVDEERQILSRLRQGERIEDFETLRVRKDGTLAVVSLTVSPVRDAEGNIVGASKIARDITERKRIEDAIRHSEAELQALADTIPQHAWMADPSGHVFWYNRRWYEYTGTSYEDVAGWGWEAVHDPDVLPSVLEKWNHSLQTGRIFEMEFPLRGADGAYRWFLSRVSPLHDEEGRVLRWFGTNTDVEQAKRVERQLREQAQTLELLNETATVVGSTLELPQLLQSITDMATKLSGAEYGAFFYAKADQEGGTYLLYSLSGAEREAFDGFGQPRNTPLFEPTFSGTGPVRSGDILQDSRYGQLPPHFGLPQGHLPVRSYMAVPVVSNTGEVIGGLFFGHSETNIFSEQTERIVLGVASQASVAIDNSRLYENLRQAADERLELLEAERAARTEAERVNLIKDEFLATLSHELRTPLSAILGWAQILEPGGSDEEELRQGLSAIERNARAQTQLIEDLLDMSRIVSGKVRLDVRPTDLCEVVVQAIESVRHSADAKEIRLRTILDPHPGPITGDPTRLQQVFWNLLSNAIKFTPKRGKVDVLLERVNSHVEVTIRDTGIGIKPEFLSLVFDRFRQADSSARRSYGGLGLGLSIVRHLVELHGGSVRAESEGEGQGATFVVCLPLAPVRESDGRIHPTAHQSPSAELGNVQLAGVRVLVVEDEPDARALIERVLRQSSAEVFTAGSAEEGLAALDSYRPDVIVSDIGMPEVDGYQFIRDVRKLPAAAGGRVPAIALTAFARSEDRTRAMLAGYQIHVAKPIEPRELIATIHSLLGRES